MPFSFYDVGEFYESKGRFGWRWDVSLYYILYILCIVTENGEMRCLHNEANATASQTKENTNR